MTDTTIKAGSWCPACGGIAMSDCHHDAADFVRSRDIRASRYWEARYRDEAERNEKLEEILDELRKTAALLLENSVGCAIEHHSIDFENEGLPGWLADCQLVIDKATEMLPVPEPEAPNMSGTQPNPERQIY